MYYLAEFYLPGDVDLADLTRHARAAAEELSDGCAAHLWCAIHVRQDESCFAVYDADSADSVAAAGTLAGITFDRIAEAVVTDCSPP